MILQSRKSSSSQPIWPCMPKICLATKATLGKVSRHDPSTKSKIWQPPPLPWQCNEILIVQRQGKPHYPPQLMLEHEKKIWNFKNIVATSKVNKNLLRSFISKGITTFLSYLETTICFLAHKLHSMHCHFLY